MIYEYILFNYLDDFCTVYLDDILIYSDNKLNHDAHVHKVLQRLQDADLQADIKKCEFSVKRTKYLGFIISTDGIEVDPEKISAVESWQSPKTVKGIQLFLGFCNFYCRFIHNYRKIVKPLVNFIKMNISFFFNQACTEAFQELKNKLTSASLLQCHELGQCSPGLWPDHVSEQCLTRSFAWMPEALRFNKDSKLQKEEERESKKN